MCSLNRAKMEASRRFISALKQFRLSVNEELRPTWANITTITMISSHLKDQGITVDPDVMRHVFKKMRYIPVKNTAGGVFQWRMFNSDFYNQVTIGYTDSLSTKKVKIFPNGSLQVAGCADLQDCKVFTKQLCLILKLVYHVDVPEDSFRTVMINSNFSLNYTIDLYRAVEVFQAAGTKVAFDPDRYSAVKIKYRPADKEITTSIFASGAAIITGANRVEDILATYKFVTEKCVQGGVYVEGNDQSEKFQRCLGYQV